MVFRLNILERIVLNDLLPAQGGIALISTVRDLRRELSFSKDERTRIDFRKTENTLQWEETADFEKEIEIPDGLLSTVKANLAKLGNDGKLTVEMVTLYDKLIEGIL